MVLNMDLKKKVSLLKWFDALSVKSINDFEDLRDAQVITDIMCTCDLLPEEVDLSSFEKRLAVVKNYLEGCYHQTFDDKKIIDFTILASKVRGDVFELEMGKLLLAFLGCGVQDKSRDRFIQPALDLDSECQINLTEMLQSLLLGDATDMKLPEDFPEVLKRKSESSSHRDAALFFKLVADGARDSPQRLQGTPNPSNSCPANGTIAVSGMQSEHSEILQFSDLSESAAFSMFSNSPQASNTSDINIRDISSPLRVMSISSPVTPLGALMYSPQLAQKIASREEEKKRQLEAILRKKMQEYKRLDLELQNEKHLRQEIEYDLEQTVNTIEEKDKKIREYEKQFAEFRKLKDNQDELEAMRQDREQQESQIKELQSRLNMQQTLKNQNQMLEKEIAVLMKERKEFRDELDMMDSIKKTNETYYIQSHKQQLTIKELESSLEHRSEEIQKLSLELEEMTNMRQVCLEKYNNIKKEKEELEDLYGNAQGAISEGNPLEFRGESMNIVTEKRLAELQADYDHIKSSWVDPVKHHMLSEQLKQAELAREGFEEQFMRTKTQLLQLESKNEKLMKQFETEIDNMKCKLAKSDEKCSGLDSQIKTFQNNEEGLQSTIRNLQQELSQLQTELMITQQELGDQKKVCEDSRLTIAKLDEVKTNSMNSEQQLRQNEKTLKKTVGELEIQIDKLKGENILLKEEVEVLKEKVSNMQEDCSELSIKLEQERSINANTVKKLNSDLAEEKKNFEQSQTSYKNLTKEYTECKKKEEAKVEELNEKLVEILKEKNAVDIALRKLEIEFSSSKEKSQVKYERLDREHFECETKLRQEVEELLRKNEDMERKHQSALQELENFRIIIEDQKESIKNSNQIIEGLKSKSASLSHDLETAKRSIIHYEHQVKTIKENLTNSQDQAVQKAETLKKQYEELISQCSREKLNLTEQLHKAETEICKLKDEMKKAHTDYNEEKCSLNQQIEKTKSEMSSLKEKHNSNISDLNKKNTFLDQKLQEAENEHESYLCKIKQIHKEEIKMLKSEIESSNDLFEEAKKLHSVEIEKLTKETEVKDSINDDLKCSNDEKNAEIDSLTEQLKYLQGVEKTLNSLLAGLETDNDTMKNMIKQREEVKDKLEKVICEKDSDIVKLSEENIRLTNQIEVNSKDAECKLETLKAEKDEIESQFMSYKAEKGKDFDTIQEKLEKTNVQKDSEIKKLNNMMCQLEEKLKCQAKDNECKLDAVIAEKDKLSRKISTLEAERKADATELKDKLVEVESYWRSQLEQLEEEYNAGTQELRNTHEKYIEELAREAEDKDLSTSSKIEELQEKIIEISKILDEKKSEVKSMRVENNNIKEELKKQTEERETEIKTLDKQHSDQLSELKHKMKVEHQEMIDTANSDFEMKVSKLQAEVEEQRVNYQQMVCNMEEKLGGENTVLKERLSQMKCQYETLIESKEKEMKKTSAEYQAQIETIRNDAERNEQQLNVERERNNKCQSEIIVLSSKVTEYEKMFAETSSIQTDLDQKLKAGSEQIKSLETELASVQKKLTEAEKELSGFRDGLNHEKGEKEELCRQLEYIQERNDTLTGELSSQQQQLAAVEEEKRQLEIQLNQKIAAHESTVTQIQQDMNDKVRMLELEKAEVERQLQSSQKCYDAILKSEREKQQMVELLKEENERLLEKNRELEQRLRAFLEDERHLKEENQHQRDRCTELNNNLQSQIRQCNTLQEANTQLKQEYEHDIRLLRQKKTALEIENAELSKVEELLKTTEAERKKLEEHTELYKLHYTKKKEIIAKQATQIAEQTKELDYYKRAEEKLINEYTPLNDKLNMEIMKNKSLGKQIRSLETQLDLANRKIKEYRQEIEKSGSVFLGDPSDFNRMLSSRENCEDASFMENHPSSVPFNTSVFEKENDDTLTPSTRSSRSHKRMGKSISSSTVSSADNADTISIGSATSLAYRLRSRESAASLNRSISSFDSCKSNVPKGTGGIFHCEDEPMEFEWGRLGELSRRNTMCPSHLKTSYPVETQLYKPSRFRDDALRESTISNDTVIGVKGQQPGSGRKRKQGWDSTDSGSDSADSKTSKQAKTGCVYKKPGPPTPANSRRSSKGSKSPNTRQTSGKRSSRSPRTPMSLQGRSTPKRTPKKKTPKRSTVMDTRSNNGSGKKNSKRESVAFNVGFSQLSLGHSNRLTRQQAFIQKQPPSSSQNEPSIRKPLGTRNFLQTGL